MKGKLYGIGTGPGDPELLTLKAIHAIEKCDVIAVPRAESSERTAFLIVERYIAGKEVLECRFSMECDEAKRKAQRMIVADQICLTLESGKSVGFITLGDPSVYSTYGYVRDLLSSRGFETETIPGVTSFSAVAATLNISLCEGDRPLHIIPAGADASIDTSLDYPGNKVIMKSGKDTSKILDILESRGLSGQTKIVSRCSMEGEQVFENIREYKESAPSGYFSVIFIREQIQ